VYNTHNYWVFGLCPSCGILETRKHNVLETGSVSVLRWGEDTYSVGLCFLVSRLPDDGQSPKTHQFWFSLPLCYQLASTHVRLQLVYLCWRRESSAWRRLWGCALRSCGSENWRCEHAGESSGSRRSCEFADWATISLYSMGSAGTILGSYAVHCNVLLHKVRPVCSCYVLLKLHGRRFRRRFPTAAACFRSQVKSCGNCGGQSGAGACFLRQFSFHQFCLPICQQSLVQLVQQWQVYLSDSSLTPPSGLRKQLLKLRHCVLVHKLNVG
jgi:hypothetical protein